MSAFAASMGLDDDRAGAASLAGALVDWGADLESAAAGRFAAACARDSVYWRPQIAAHEAGLLAVGMVRLNAASDIASSFGWPAPDLERDGDLALLLTGYQRKGLDFLRSISGDFAALIWEPASQKLIAMVDQFGARPLFYAKVGDRLVLSDALDALIALPGIDCRLDDSFIADTLAMGFATDPSATPYRGVRRLPPAHVMEVESGRERVHCYWQPPERGPLLIYRREEDYAAHFRELFFAAVADRLPRRAPIGVLMSGGLDSTSVAAAARELLGAEEAAARVTAYTSVVRTAPDDREGEFARLVTDHLGIQARVFDYEDFVARPYQRDARPPIPGILAGQLPALTAAREVARGGGVLLGGIGADGLLNLGDVGTAELWRSGAAATLVAMRHWRVFGRPPRIGLRMAAGRLIRGRPSAAPLPIWISPDLVQRTQLEARLHAYRARIRFGAGGLNSPFWASMLSLGTSSMMRLPFESGHPFIDRRLVEFALRLPEPQLAGKRVLRRAMAGSLPRAVVERPKTPLGAAALTSLWDSAARERRMTLLDRVGRAGEFFDMKLLRQAFDSPSVEWGDLLLVAEAALAWLAPPE